MSANSENPTALISVREAASLLGVSETWVRRHVGELPAVRVGRLVRFDSALLLRKFQGRVSAGNRLKPEGTLPMVNKRRYQQGSVIKRGKRGRQVWYGIWREDVPMPEGGFTRRQRYMRLGPVSELPNRSMARERLSRLMNQKPSPQMQFSELCERWTAVVIPTLKQSTADMYSFKLSRYVIPSFGTHGISEISRYDVETFLTEKAKQGFSRNTLRGMRASLSQVFSWAVEHDWIAKNPCNGVELPQAGKKVKRLVLKPEQVKAIANELPEPYATLVLLLAVTGLRVGEAVGIKWSDFDGEFLHVQRRIYERREGTTKTEESDRYIPVPSALLERMRELPSIYKTRRTADSEWVFQSRNGTPLDPKNAGNRYLRPAVRKLGIALGGWHDFRHTLATQLLNQRHSAKLVSELLGHSDVKTTLEIYSHVEPENFRAPLNERASELLASVSKCPVLQQPAEGEMLN